MFTLYKFLVYQNFFEVCMKFPWNFWDISLQFFKIFSTEFIKFVYYNSLTFFIVTFFGNFHIVTLKFNIFSVSPARYYQDFLNLLKMFINIFLNLPKINSNFWKSYKLFCQSLHCFLKTSYGSIRPLGHTIHCLGHGFKSDLPIGPLLSDMLILF